MIGIVSPAGSVEKDKVRKGIEILRSLSDLTFVEHVHLYNKDKYLAGSDFDRARQINDFFSDKRIKAIICARGGYGCLRILPLIDWRLVIENPKPFIGFSDITALLTTFYDKCHLKTFHGPVMTSVSSIDEQSIQKLHSLLSTDEVLLEAYFDAPFELSLSRVIIEGESSGILYGGNLTTLCHLTGTPYEPDYQDKILILEDIEEPAYKIDRMLTQLKLAGCFEELNGVVLGTFENCGDKQIINEIVASIFASFNIPVAVIDRIGHGNKNDIIPHGSKVLFDTSKGIIKLNHTGI